MQLHLRDHSRDNSAENSVQAVLNPTQGLAATAHLSIADLQDGSASSMHLGQAVNTCPQKLGLHALGAGKGTTVAGLLHGCTSSLRLPHSIPESWACMHPGPAGAHLSQACRMAPLAGCSRARPLTVSLKAANTSRRGAEPSSVLLLLEPSPPNPMPPGDASEMPKTTRMRVTKTAALRSSRGCGCSPAGACRAAVR